MMATPNTHLVSTLLFFDCLFSLLNEQRRQTLWTLALAAFSRAPHGTITTLRIQMHLVPYASLHAKDRSTASQSIGALRDLRWDLLDDVLDKHPQLQSIEIWLVYDGPRLTSSQIALVQGRLSIRLRQAVRFHSRYEELSRVL